MTLYPKLNLVIPLTVWDTISERQKVRKGLFDILANSTFTYQEKDFFLALYLLADIFSTQHFLADFTLKAAEVPLACHRQQSLSIFNVSATTRAV